MVTDPQEQRLDRLYMRYAEHCRRAGVEPLPPEEARRQFLAWDAAFALALATPVGPQH